MRPFIIHVVLVRPQYDSNIGASSRAMANMDSKDLILIDRQCTITYQAQQAAASGQQAFLNRREYDSWDDFFKNEPDGLRFAFSARDGQSRPLWDFSEALQWVQKNEPRMQQEKNLHPLAIYFIFGPESAGLTNADIELAHFNVRLPTFGSNSSLNLAQAVLLALYTLRLQWGRSPGTSPANGSPTFAHSNAYPVNLDSEAASTRAEIFPEETLRVWLTEMGFDLSKPVNAYTVLKRILLHNVPNPKELRMLETILQQSIRKLREYNQLRTKFLGNP